MEKDNNQEQKSTLKSVDNYDECIKVVNPSIFIILGAALILLIGYVIWTIAKSNYGV